MFARKKVLVTSILILSSVALGIILAMHYIVDFIIFPIIGVLLVLYLYKMCSNRIAVMGVVEKSIAAILLLVISYKSSKIFYKSLVDSEKIDRLLNVMPWDRDSDLKVVTLIVVVMALPATFIAIIGIIELVKKIYKCIRYKILFKIIKESSNTLCRELLISCVIVISAAFLGAALIICVYYIPTEKIEENVRKSAEVFQKEGTYPELFSWCQSQLDNFTDALMLLEAADDNSSSVVDRAMMVYRGRIGDKNPCDTMVSHYVDGQEFTEIRSYSRYWHGYLVLLKPLLYVTDYSTIRILNGVFQLLLVIVVCVMMAKRGMKKYILPYLIAYLMFMPVAIAMSLQYSPCWYIMTFGIIAVMALGKKHGVIYLVFLCLGILTAYCDFLTYPVITFGVPAVLYVAIRHEDDLETKLSYIIKFGLEWVIGYGGMWMSKWIISTWLTGCNTLGDAINQVRFRTSNSSLDGLVKYSAYECTLTNYDIFFRTPITVLAFIYIAYNVYVLARGKKMVDAYRVITPYAVIGILPVVWYMFALNHSSIHAWFASRECVITLIAAMFCVVDLKRSLQNV